MQRSSEKEKHETEGVCVTAQSLVWDMGPSSDRGRARAAGRELVTLGTSPGHVVERPQNG